MKHHIVAIRDIKTNSYFTPQYVKSIGGYIRQVSDEINSPQQANTLAHTMANHPEDFEIYNLGTWDDEDARYLVDVQTQICVLTTLKR